MELPAAGVYWVGGGSPPIYAGPSLVSVLRGAAALAPATGFVILERDRPLVRKATHRRGRDYAMGRVLVDGARMAALGRILGRVGDQYLVEVEHAYRPSWAIRKKLDPMKPKDFDEIVVRVNRILVRGAGQVSSQELTKLIKGLKFDWSKATDAKLRAFSRKMNQAMRIVADRSWVAVKGKLDVEAKAVGNDTRASVIATHELELGSNLRSVDMAVVRRIASSQQNFVTDFYTKDIAPTLSAEARVVVADGLQKGLGNNAIGADLNRVLGDKMKGRERPYFNVVANAFVNRARSFSALATFAEAGIEKYFISAVLDEVTTDTCRMLDGKELLVSAALDQFQRADDLKDPRDVKFVQPWVRERAVKSGDDEGKLGLWVPQRGKPDRLIGVVQQSGVGQQDVKGKFSKVPGANGLMESGIGSPPYHGSCRTTIIPVV